MKRSQLIRPLSVVRLMRADSHTPRWRDQIGRTFRIGYYSRQDGTDCVWLVNDAGEYEQTVDQGRLNDFFDLVRRSNERSLFGRNRPPIPPLANGRAMAHRLPPVNGFQRAVSPPALKVH